jgi:hypothetical protein
MKVLGVEVPPAKVEREPVLDVPAIDMTTAPPEEAVSPSTAEAVTADVAKPARPSRAKPKPSARSPKRSTNGKAPKRSRNGSIGRETYEAVEALVEDGTKKTEAFNVVAGRTGRSASTVAATYYRLAGADRTVKPPRTRRSETKATSRASASSAPIRREGRQSAGLNGDIDRLTGDLVSNVQALAKAMQAQSREVSELRQRLDGVRSLLR